MLTFAIPTWNRATKLKVCIDSICEQIKDRDGYFLVVCDNGSTDDTKKILQEYDARYNFFSYQSLPKMIDGASCVNSVNMVKTDWTWTFGDDDILLPQALDKVVAVIEKHPNLFYLHATQSVRTDKSKKLFSASTFLDLCESYGWLDVSGFISSNICRTDELQKAYAHYLFYNSEIETIFPHSACLLETIHDRPSALLDDELVGLQDNVQTEDTIQRWRLANAATRYFYVGDSLLKIMERVPKLKKTFPAVFFRYHTYHLWDRLLRDIVGEFKAKRTPIPGEIMEKITILASMVSDAEVRKRILTVLSTEKKAMESIQREENMLDKVKENCEIAVYGLKNIVVLPPHIKTISEKSVDYVESDVCSGNR